MKKLLLATIVGVFVMLAGCKKDAPIGIDVTQPWLGIYNGSPTGSPSQILIYKNADSTLKVEIKITEDWYQYTAVTLQNVTIKGNNAIINETQHIIEDTDLGAYRFTGSISLTGAQVNMNVTAESVDPKNENSPQNFAFAGAKQ